MRLRLHTGATALFGAMLMVALVVFLPLRVALGWAGLADYGIAAGRVSGTIWGGTVRDVRIGSLALGTLDAALSPWALLLGRARIEVATPGQVAELAIRGAVGSSRHGFFLDDATADVATGLAFQPLPVTRLTLEDVTVHFTDGRCDLATGRVSATLGGAPTALQLPPSVAGSIRCDGTAVLIPLLSTAGSEGITVRMEGSGRYHAELKVAASDPVAVQQLQAAGFIGAVDGYRLTVEGSL